MQKTAVAVAHVKRGNGMIKLNGMFTFYKQAPAGVTHQSCRQTFSTTDKLLSVT